MAPRKEYSPRKRAIIVEMYRSGQSHTAIAYREGVARGSIAGIVKRYSTQTKGRSEKRIGRPKKITARDMRYLQRQIDADAFTEPSEMCKLISLGCHPRTIMRALAAIGIFHLPALRRPFLTAEHAAKRLAFARKYVDKPIEYWQN